MLVLVLMVSIVNLILLFVVLSRLPKRDPVQEAVERYKQTLEEGKRAE